MRVAITGGNGFVGRFLAEAALLKGHTVTVLGRSPAAFTAPVAHLAYDLRQPPPRLDGFDALIHAAFLHEPGRYRGGEGDDPAGFLAANRDGTLRLFDAARRLDRVLFLSSRAVYGDYPDGTLLTEALPLRPDTLYGQVKAEAEAAVPAGGASLRPTGVYGPAGPGQRHKWADLFDDYRAGRPITPRVATEVHGDDLAAAAMLLLDRSETGAFNVSDLVLDRHDLLAEVARHAGGPPPPTRANADTLNVMDCSRLHALGWKPGGWRRLVAALPYLI